MSRRMKQRDEGEMRGANLARIDDGSCRMPTSATERRTDSTRTSRHVRFVPNGDIRSRIEIAAETPSARSSRIEIARLYNEVGTAHKRVL